MIERPWMLLGLLAALLPLWLHLRGRRSARVVVFSALAFLLDRDPRRARAARMRERLLIAVRMAVAGGVALALAGPLLPSCDAVPADLGAAPLALVVVLDDSLSMTATPGGGGALFEVARARALALVAALPRESRVAVVTTSRPAVALSDRLLSDLRSVRAELTSLQPRAAGDDVERALTIAGRLLADTPAGRVVVLSDLNGPGWADVIGAGVAGVRVDVERVGGTRVDAVAAADDPNAGNAGTGNAGAKSLSNTAVLAAHAAPAPEHAAGEVRLVAEIGHVGDRPYAGHFVVRLGEREIRRRIELAPNERRTIELPIGVARDVADVGISGSDDLNADNRRLVRLGGDTALRIAIVNGAPRPVPREDEVFFMRRALDVGVSGPGELDIEVVTVADLDDARLGRYDVLVLANVPELPANSLAALVRRLEAGHGVVVTVGDASASSAELGWLAGLLPGWLDGVQPGGSELGVRSVAADTNFAAGTRGLVEQLATVVSGLGDLRVRQHIGLRPRPDVDSHVALRFADGAPALLAFERGRGMLLLWTTSIDLDWADVPMQPGFVPFVAILARAAANTGAARLRTALEPGIPFELARGEHATSLAVQDAEGLAVPVAIKGSATGKRWRVAGLPSPGQYTAIERGAAGAVARHLIIVSPPTGESGAGPIASPLLGRHGADDADTVNAGADDADAVNADEADEGDAGSTHYKVPVAPYALLALLALLALEGGLVLRGSERWRALRRRPT